MKNLKSVLVLLITAAFLSSFVVEVEFSYARRRASSATKRKGESKQCFYSSSQGGGLSGVLAVPHQINTRASKKSFKRYFTKGSVISFKEPITLHPAAEGRTLLKGRHYKRVARSTYNNRYKCTLETVKDMPSLKLEELIFTGRYRNPIGPSRNGWLFKTPSGLEVVLECLAEEAMDAQRLGGGQAYRDLKRGDDYSFIMTYLLGLDGVEVKIPCHKTANFMRRKSLHNTTPPQPEDSGSGYIL